MASFLLQVQGITQLTVGVTPTNDELSQFLVDGTREVTNRIITIRPDETAKFTSSTHDSNDSGIAVTGQIISVVREHDSDTILRSCNMIEPRDRYEATDASSLSYRSKYNPGFYILDGKLHTVPAAAAGNNDAIVTQVYYAVNTGHSSSSIDNFPDEYEYLVVLYASLRTISAKMGSKTITDQALIPVIPTSPVVPNFTFTVSTSLPTYTTPTQTINSINWATAYPDQQANIDTALAKVSSALNAVDSLGLSKLTLDPYVSTAVSPDVPVQPNFTISLSESLPSAYTKLITSYDPGAPTDLSAVHPFSQTVTDIAAFSGITAVSPDQPTFETVNFTGAGANASATVISTSNANVASLGDVDENVVTLPTTAPTYVPPAPPNRPDFETSITAEDVEIVGAKAQQYSTDLGLYQAELSDSVNEFNKSNAIYQLEMQKSLADAQQDNAMILQSLQKNLTIAQADAAAANTMEQANKAADMQNAVTEMQEIMNQNTIYLQEWQQSLAQYQGEVGAEVQDYQAKLSKYSQEIQKELTVWQQERQGEIAEHGQKIARFQALIGDELNAFNTGLQKYQAEIATKLQEAQYEQQAEHAADLQQYQAEVATYGTEVNAEVQDYTQYLAEQQQEFASAVQTYATLIQTAQAFASEIQLRLAPRTVEIQEYQAKVSEALNSFNAGLQKYQAELQKELQEAQYEQQAEYASKLQQYQADIAAYQADVAAGIQEYQNNLQADQAEYVWLQDQYTRLKAEYEAAFVALTPLRQAEQSAGARPRA